MDSVDVGLFKWLLSDRSKNAKSVLGDEHRLDYRQVVRFAVGTFSEALKMTDHLEKGIEADVKLRLAMHLCPAAAMNWDSGSSLNRVEVIADYIESTFAFNKSDAIDLARTVAATLRAWETRRATLADRVASLLARQDGRCRSCHVSINESRILEDESRNPHERDQFKPYFLTPGVRSWLSAEVDHKDPISVFGTNETRNLQVLCRLCNAGKSDGATLSTRHEYDNCHLDIASVKDAHRRRILYCRFEMDGFKCRRCGSQTNELTIRKRQEGGCLVLTNLYSICYQCIGVELLKQ